MHRLFVTGTDTGVGKTYVTCLIMQALKNRGLSVVGLKPIASGCRSTPQGLRNSDALALQRMSSNHYAYERINPLAFLPPIAPHIAAQQLGESLSVARLQAVVDQHFSEDVMVMEGAGGWLLPLNERETLADFVATEKLSVILVVGMRLGCLNHALLTVKAIRSAGVNLLGWVANQVVAEPVLCLQDNIASLQVAIAAPCLGVVPHNI